MDERSVRQVFDDHLRQAQNGALDDDLARNYADDVVFLTGFEVFEAHEGMRALHERLRKKLGNARFNYHSRNVRGDMAFLEWTAESDRGRVRDGVDSYLIRDGRIAVQTIHDTVEPAASRDKPEG